MNADERLVFSAGARATMAACGIAAAAAFAYGLFLEPVRAWANLLTDAFYFLTLALGAAVFIAMNAVSNAAWYVVVKRGAEAISSFVPVGAVVMLVVLAGSHSLYHWSHADAVAKDPILAQKSPWLNLPFFAGRMVFLLGLWTFLTWLMRRYSRAQDRDGDLRHTHRVKVVSAVFLLLFAYTFSMASFDWLMSLEPHWYSTMYAFYNIAGLLTAGTAVVAGATIVLRRMGLLPQVTEHHLHDFGKLLFGFCTFWGYIWLFQFLLIWYANLPEEVAHYRTRWDGGWAFLFWLNVVLNFALPFLALLPRGAKRYETHLLWVCGTLLLGRWLDVYLLVAPSVMPEHQGIGLQELGLFVGLGALFVWVVARGLRAAPLVPERDPYLGEALHLHQ